MQLSVEQLPGRFLVPVLCCLVAGCAALGGDKQSAAVFGERRVESPIFESAAECREHLSRPAVTQDGRGFRSTFTVASWNTQKSKGPVWQSELRALARQADLLLLQEAAIVPAAKEFLSYPFVAVAEGYYSVIGPTGVLSASDADPLGSCAFVTREPLLRSRKASSITIYPIAGRPETLLVANIHSINFSLGLGAFERQLRQLARTMRNHRGPVIFAGDFNVWNSPRKRVVNDIVHSLGLSEVVLRPDIRKRVFGHPLDRIYSRGLTLVDAGTETLTSSDHNALIATFTIPRQAQSP